MVVSVIYYFIVEGFWPQLLSITEWLYYDEFWIFFLEYYTDNICNTYFFYRIEGLIFFLVKLVIRPSCMAVSWSYVRQFGPSFLRINHFPFALLWSFLFLHFFNSRLFYFCIFFSTLFFPIILWSNSDGPGQTRLLCFPFWQSNFIKLFDVGLKYEVIQTFYTRSYRLKKDRRWGEE